MECRIHTRSWTPASLPDVECFRASGLRQQYARHTHGAYAIGAFEAGVGVSRYRGATRTFPPRHIVAMNPEEPHNGGAAGPHGITYRMFYVPAETFERFTGARPFFRSVCIDDPATAALLLRAHAALETEASASGGVLFAQALQTLVERHGAGVRVAEGRESKLTERVKAHLAAHCAGPVSLAALAALAGVSEGYLTRTFTREAGIPPHAWLLQLRVERSKQLLRQGQAIADVASRLGFADQSHFTRRFRRITGLTPGRFIAS